MEMKVSQKHSGGKTEKITASSLEFLIPECKRRCRWKA
jgi:hypothetical protein